MRRPAVSLLVRVTAPVLLLLACCSRPRAEERTAALSAGQLPAATAAANALVSGETSPLRDWMKSNASPALSAANFEKLRSVFDRIGRIALKIQALNVVRTGTNERKAALVIGVDQLGSVPRRFDQDAEPAKRVGTGELRPRALWDRLSAHAMKSVAARDEIAGELMRAIM